MNASMIEKELPALRQFHASVGILGLGIIGKRVAEILQNDKTFSVFVWNRSPRSLPNFLASPQAVAESAAILQLFVRDGVALLEVLEQLSPALNSSHLVLNHATVSPQETLQAAALVNKRGAQFLDAPFTGSRDAAAAGKLVYYLGGSSEAIEKVTPLLKLSSKEILPMGAIGSATTVKIATNMITAAQVNALTEALTLLQLTKIPLQSLHQALIHNAAYSPVIAMKLPLMLQGNFEPHFSTKNMFKDLSLALDLAKEHSVALPLTATTAAALENLISQGLGDQDFSALAHSL
ncbi:MAG: NAD(P)-dependent oxidoreductase [Verrucomicrobia bacterium]|nr:MAG: NAD(P)-dependent oxidoreductase [Verrucomicrobiota bacterium]